MPETFPKKFQIPQYEAKNVEVLPEGLYVFGANRVTISSATELFPPTFKFIPRIFYCEMTLVSEKKQWPYGYLGISNFEPPIDYAVGWASRELSSEPFTIGYHSDDDKIFRNGATTSLNGKFLHGDTMGLLINLDKEELFYTKNGAIVWETSSIPKLPKNRQWHLCIGGRSQTSWKFNTGLTPFRFNLQKYLKSNVQHKLKTQENL